MARKSKKQLDTTPTKQELEFIAKASALTILSIEAVINNLPALRQVLQPALDFANGGLEQVIAHLGREETFHIAAKAQSELEAALVDSSDNQRKADHEGK